MISGAAFQVLDYGAVGDGVTDDTAAIQAAITAARDADGGTVEFPPFKEFLVSSNIEILWRPTTLGGTNGERLNITIHGNRSKLVSNHTGVMMTLQGDTANILSRVKSVYIYDLIFQGSGTAGVSTNSIGVNFRGTFFCSFVNCQVDDCERGIQLTGTSELLVEDYNSFNCGYAIWGSGESDNYDGTSQDLSSIDIVRPIIGQWYDAAIYLKSAGLLRILKGTIAVPQAGADAGIHFDNQGLGGGTRSIEIQGTVFEFQTAPTNGGIYFTNSDDNAYSADILINGAHIQSVAVGMKAFNFNDSDFITLNNIRFKTGVAYTFVETHDCNNITVLDGFPFSTLKNCLFYNTTNIIIPGYVATNPNPTGTLQRVSGTPYSYGVAASHPVGSGTDYAGRPFVQNTTGTGYLAFTLSGKNLTNAKGQKVIGKMTAKCDATAKLRAYDGASNLGDANFPDTGTEWLTRFLEVQVDATITTNLQYRFETTSGSSTQISEMDILVNDAKINIELFGSDVPSVGTWEAGDIIYDSTPSAGGHAGWICTTAGSPGTWKTFGNITA